MKKKVLTLKECWALDIDPFGGCPGLTLCWDGYDPEDEEQDDFYVQLTEVVYYKRTCLLKDIL